MNNKFSIGDPVPNFYCASSNNKEFHFDTAAGRYIVLCFYGSASVAKTKGVIDFVSGEARHLFDDNRVCFFGVSVDRKDKDEGRAKQIIPGIRFFWDYSHKVSQLYAAMHDNSLNNGGMIRYRPFTLILDPNLRVVANIPLDDTEKHNARLVEVLEKLPPVEEYSGVPVRAPILTIPNVLEPELCQELIRLYEKHGGQETGTMVEEGGYTVGKLDTKFKSRADCVVNDSKIVTSIKHRIFQRIAPEIKKAFQFDVTAVERYIVACYDSENKGFFRPHRDNTTKGTAHRKFACTINLNAGDYEGGELRFPEFGPQTYRAPTGGAIIFSCSLLHEATPVTSGKRYATLPFLYDQSGVELRCKNLEFLANSEDAVGKPTSLNIC